MTLELQAGSVIEGNVLANATSAGDIFRLGGTANDIFDVSAIGPQYQNFDTYEKTGTSTWALTGTGTATTNWNIQDGTLQLGNGGTSGSVIGNLTTASAGTLAFNRSDTFTFNNLVLGTGTISQIGTGTTIMTADNSAFAGSTTIKAGTLSVNGILGGTVNVQTGGRLQGTGQVGTTTSDGTIAPGNSIGTLTIDGNYTGNGGTLEIESELGGDASPTDRLVVTGDTAGTTSVRVTNLGGTGAQTVEGIKIVDVGGASNGVFSLLGDYVIAGQQAVVARCLWLYAEQERDEHSWRWRLVLAFPIGTDQFAYDTTASHWPDLPARGAALRDLRPEPAGAQWPWLDAAAHRQSLLGGRWQRRDRPRRWTGNARGCTFAFRRRHGHH